MPTLLIDADEYLFNACVVTEIDIRWDEYNHVLQANEREAWNNFATAIDRLATKFNTQDVTLCFSSTYSTPNFRLAVDPTYKAARADKRKPLCYAALREEAEGTYDTKTFPGLEADDVMGILATKPGADAIIVSQDKDMKTLPAKIWTGEKMIQHGEEEADYWHLYQTLTGDTVDGFKGCPGIGPVKAEKMLMDPHLWDGNAEFMRAAAWRVVVGAYEKAGLTEADAITQARLARILRWGDWDKKKKVPILWTPYPTK
jgi:DNA polymerase-1